MDAELGFQSEDDTGSKWGPRWEREFPESRPTIQLPLRCGWHPGKCREAIPGGQDMELTIL